MESQDELMSVTEIAQEYDISRQSIYLQCRNGKLHGIQGYRCLLVRRGEVERYLALSYAGRRAIWVAITTRSPRVTPWLAVSMGMHRGRLFSAAVELIQAGGPLWDAAPQTYIDNLKLVGKTVARRKFGIAFTPREIPAEDVMNVPIIPWVE